MAVKQNQGFRKDLNLAENTNDTQTLSNLAGPGIANDLRIIQNNLRNIGTISYNSIQNGFFFFGDDFEFVFTNDDVVTVSTTINVGSSNLVAGNEYYVANSNGRNQFKLSLTPSNVGVSTIQVTTVSNTNFLFIRKDYVTRENLINFIQPDIQDTENFNYIDGGNINGAIETIQDNQDVANYFISSKYRGDADTSARKKIRIEGTITTQDPTRLNASDSGLDSEKAPGVFILGTRAFSTDNNPWTKVGTALSTGSSLVSMGELYFSDEVRITGIGTELATSVEVSSFTHKIPVRINGEVYYLLLRSS